MSVFTCVLQMHVGVTDQHMLSLMFIYSILQLIQINLIKKYYKKTRGS